MAKEGDSPAVDGASESPRDANALKHIARLRAGVIRDLQADGYSEIQKYQSDILACMEGLECFNIRPTGTIRCMKPAVLKELLTHVVKESQGEGEQTARDTVSAILLVLRDHRLIDRRTYNTAFSEQFEKPTTGAKPAKLPSVSAAETTPDVEPLPTTHTYGIGNCSGTGGPCNIPTYRVSAPVSLVPQHGILYQGTTPRATSHDDGHDEGEFLGEVAQEKTGGRRLDRALYDRSHQHRDTGAGFAACFDSYDDGASPRGWGRE